MSNFKIILLLIAVLWSAKLSAQVPVDRKQEIVDSIALHTGDWEKVTLSGKLKMDGLPLSPSMKIFMEKDSSIMISLRAPFMGEVGRAEFSGDSLLVVNKMKKTYVKESLSSLLSGYPLTIGDVQNIILGNIVIAGAGTLSQDNMGCVDLFEAGEGTTLVIPVVDMEIEQFKYGYVIDDFYRISALRVIPLSKEETTVSLDYSYMNKGYDLTVIYESPRISKMGTLQLDNPEWGGNAMDPVNLSRYKRMYFTEFLKSF